MKIINGIAYATTEVATLEAVRVKALDDYMLIVEFNNLEERLFDATTLFSMPAFVPLKDDAIFKNCRVIDGVVSWSDGDIDLAPETMYQESFPYQHIDAV